MVLEVCVDKSNEVLQNYLNLADSKYRSRTEHVFDAHYFRVLNFVLRNKVDDAINELEFIEKSKRSLIKEEIKNSFWDICPFFLKRNESSEASEKTEAEWYC